VASLSVSQVDLLLEKPSPQVPGSRGSARRARRQRGLKGIAHISTVPGPIA